MMGHSNGIYKNWFELFISSETHGFVDTKNTKKQPGFLNYQTKIFLIRWGSTVILEYNGM